MAFVFTAALQGRIALAVWNVTNSSLTADQKTQLDNTWTSGSLTGGAAYDAYVEVAQLAQWFEQAASAPDASYPQPAWDRLFIAKCGMILTKTVRPDRYALFAKDHDEAIDALVDTFTRTLASSTSMAGTGAALTAIRSYVIDGCVKRANSSTGNRRRLFPPINMIDAEIEWTLNYVWNRYPWNFRKRQVTLKMTQVSVTNGTWTESSKTLTSASAFTNANIAKGTRLIATSGTGVTVGEYVVDSRTDSSNIVLQESLSSEGSDLSTGDIAVQLNVVTMQGLQSGESFDQVVSRKFHFQQNYYSGGKLAECDSDAIAEFRSCHETTTGRPCLYRISELGQSKSWNVVPFPDGNYTFYGAVAVKAGTVSTATNLATEIAKFPTEFPTVIRDMVYGRVLMRMGASDGESVYASATQACENLLPTYSDMGAPGKMRDMTDVYDDYDHMVG